MKKALMLLPFAALAMGAAQAGTYSVLQDSDCPLVTKGQLSQAVQKAGASTGLDLPRDMVLRTELHCASDRNGRFVYTIRAAIEKQLNDGEQQRWAPVAYLTGYGSTRAGSALLRQVQFTVQDVIRQEP